MISNVYMKHAKVSLKRPRKKVDRARVAAVIIFMSVMLGICILPQLLYGMEAMQSTTSAFRPRLEKASG